MSTLKLVKNPVSLHGRREKYKGRNLGIEITADDFDTRDPAAENWIDSGLTNVLDQYYSLTPRHRNADHFRCTFTFDEYLNVTKGSVSSLGGGPHEGITLSTVLDFSHGSHGQVAGVITIGDHHIPKNLLVGGELESEVESIYNVEGYTTVSITTQTSVNLYPGTYYPPRHFVPSDPLSPIRPASYERDDDFIFNGFYVDSRLVLDSITINSSRDASISVGSSIIVSPEIQGVTSYIPFSRYQFCVTGGSIIVDLICGYGSTTIGINNGSTLQVAGGSHSYVIPD